MKTYKFSLVSPYGKELFSMLPPYGRQGHFRFEGPYAITVDKLLQGSENTRPRNRACELLLEWLTKHGRLSVEEIMALADSEGISKRTLHRAKSQLPIQSVRSDEKWYWELCSPTT
ncbi:MAG: hypothetical protein E7503_01975 [Ruminococcus sp.]|nr:hypothetical protein [Ruminococcus sp.]